MSINIYSQSNTIKTCLQCKTALKNTLNKFCNRSCSASFNNKGKIRSNWSTKQRLKFSQKQKQNKIAPPIKSFCDVCFPICKICNNIFSQKGSIMRKKTCSIECQVIASTQNRTYINGKRLNIYYFNQWENKTILLESSWEEKIAKELDKLNIKWIRPKPIIWFDNVTNKNRLYYPDFYLPEVDLYLDPKNPYAMKNDEHKMKSVEKLINIIYGDVEYIRSALSGI